MAREKDKVIVNDPDMDVTFVPVTDYGTSFHASPADIVGSVGGSTKGLSEEAGEWEGHVPESNRNGETAQEDSQLARIKQEIQQRVDASIDESVSPNSVDPRDNPKAPDKWENKDDKAGADSKIASKDSTSKK